MWRVIKNLDASVESCVRLGDEFTDFFQVELGLRQGDSLSPILYLIFIDGLIKVIREALQGIMLGSTKLNILGFADDLTLLATSKADMQKLLDMVYMYSQQWRFLFNVDKSKILVFTNKRVKFDPRSLYL